MRRIRPSITHACLVGALGSFAGLVACSSLTASGASGPAPTMTPEAGSSSAASPTVIAVHASYNFPAFRVCVQGLDSLQPLPNHRTMPQSNLIGVEIGNAVHLGDLPLPGASSFDGGFARNDGGIDSGSTLTDAGDASVITPIDAGRVDAAAPTGTTKIYVIDEAAIRGKTGTCAQILPTVAAADVATLTVTDAEATTLFSSNVSFITLTGCRSGVALSDPPAALRACGSDYRADTGNLRLSVIAASYQPRFASGFYAQVLPLSPALATTTVEFAELSGEPTNPAQNLGTTPAYRTIGPTAPFPVNFRGLESDFGRFGFRVYDTSTAARKLLREQTLADIATFSDPRLLPTEYFQLPSNFVMLLIGNPDDVTRSVEPGRKLHVVAIPLREPSIDGVDGGN